MPTGGLLESDSAIYMKGNKGVAVSGGQTTIADFTKQEITIIDTERKKYATVPAADYATRLSESMPQMGAASPMMTMQTKCESSQTGRTEVIQGVHAEEREQTCSIEMAGMSMKFVTHIWSAAAGERPRVPALWHLSGYELWQKYFMNPNGALRTQPRQCFSDFPGNRTHPLFRSRLTWRKLWNGGRNWNRHCRDRRSRCLRILSRTQAERISPDARTCFRSLRKRL